MFVEQAGKDHDRNVARFAVGDAKAVDEFAFDAKALEGRGENASAAVDDEDFVTLFRKGSDLRGEFAHDGIAFQQSTSEFDDKSHCSPVLLLNSQKMVEILYGLASGTFAEIVETRDDDEPAAGTIECEADVRKIGVRDVLQFPGALRLSRCGPWGGLRRSCGRALRWLREFAVRGERDVDRGKNAAGNGQQVRRKNELRFG